MILVAAVGEAESPDAREAGIQAAHQAHNALGTASPSLCLIIVPYHYDYQQVVTGVANTFPNIPMMGLSVSSGLSRKGVHSKSVIVAVLAGDSLQAETHWFPAYSQASAETAIRLSQLLGYERRPVEQVLVFADGLNGNTDEFCRNLPVGLPVFGGLSSSDPQSANSFQIAGQQSGSGSLAAAFLRGNIKVNTGYGHGWHAVGSHFKVTRSSGFWLRTLDGNPVSESYAHLFGRDAREWANPPLNTLSRIYPLGFEQEHRDDLLVRSHLRVEVDGSFRMNSGLRDGSDAYLMIGSPTDCLDAARLAAKQAMEGLGTSKPVFALVLADVAWHMLLQARAGEEIKTVQDVLGIDVPVAGGYTIGQIVPPREPDEPPQFLNQHIVVAVFGEK